MKKTNTGRVVYTRPRHFYTIADVRRIYSKAILSDPEDLSYLTRTITLLFLDYVSQRMIIVEHPQGAAWFYDETRKRLDELAAALIASNGSLPLFNSLMAV